MDRDHRTKLVGVEETDSRYLFLGDMITGNLLGADRLDYLLRDSYHAGVTYGHYDLARVLDTVRVCISEQWNSPVFAIEFGGLPAAESMLLARHFMFKQVYLHPLRRIYDHMLTTGMKALLDPQHLTIDEFLSWTDDEVLCKLRQGLAEHQGEFWTGLFTRQHPKLIRDVNTRPLEASRTPLSKVRDELRHLIEAEGFDPERLWIDVVDKLSRGRKAEPEQEREMPVLENGTNKIRGTFEELSNVFGMIADPYVLRIYCLDRALAGQATAAVDKALVKLELGGVQ